MVDPERVEAKLKDGLLTVHVSKREELKPRQIEVSVQ
jgi:HSP20 family molecular chaperone IbpA